MRLHTWTSFHSVSCGPFCFFLSDMSHGCFECLHSAVHSMVWVIFLRYKALWNLGYLMLAHTIKRLFILRLFNVSPPNGSPMYILALYTNYWAHWTWTYFNYKIKSTHPHHFGPPVNHCHCYQLWRRFSLCFLWFFVFFFFIWAFNCTIITSNLQKSRDEWQIMNCRFWNTYKNWNHAK